MNTPKHSLHLVAGATLALCSALAQAAPTQAELDSIVLYGNTTIAKDSALSWGLWEQIDPPAAGPQLPRIDYTAKAEWYRPLAQATLNTTPVEVLCTSGSLCGFGMFYEPNFKALEPLALSEEPAPVMERYSPDFHPYWLTAKAVDAPAAETITLEQAQEVRATWALPAALQVLGTALSTGNLAMPDSGTLVEDGGGYYYRMSSGPNSPAYYLYIDVNSNNEFYDAAAVQASFYSGQIYTYVNGQGEGGYAPAQFFSGVIGTTTASADMSALRASGATATYAGYDLMGETVTPNVILNVKFGDGSFTGSFNGGADDGNLQGRGASVYTTATGKSLQGMVGFNVTSGVITGSEFKSTGLSASDGTVTGTVRGAFFGPMAAAAGGVADVTKSRTDGAYTNARFVSPFLTIKNLNPTSVRRRFLGG